MGIVEYLLWCVSGLIFGWNNLTSVELQAKDKIVGWIVIVVCMLLALLIVKILQQFIDFDSVGSDLVQVVIAILIFFVIIMLLIIFEPFIEPHITPYISNFIYS